MHAFLQDQAPKIAAQVNALRSTALKALLAKDELTQDQRDEIDRILAAVDLAGFSVLAGDVEKVLEGIAADGGSQALLQVHIDVTTDPGVLEVVNGDAVAYAANRSAELVGMTRDAAGDLVPNPDARWAIDESTRQMIRGEVTQALADGWSNDELASNLAGSRAFSLDRAMTIARTETQMAANAGAIAGYKASGVVDGKQWITAGDDLVSEDCVENGEAGDNGDGVLGLDEIYPSGDAAPPAHPNCRCTIVPYIEPAKETQ